MKISERDWVAYIDKLSAINEKAGDKLKEYIERNGTNDVESLITYAHALVTRYGEAGSELACEMYDALATAQGANVPLALPAQIASRREVAGTVLATKDTQNFVPAVQRLVKTAASDTMLRNAKRDHAEWAWISHGDTCAFCMVLSSKGWQPASKAVLRGDHAEHIHANCDCEFAVRFDGKSTVEGYNPQRFKKIYDSAPGRSSIDKINAIRREQYAEIKDARNARRRELYAESHLTIVYPNGEKIHLSKDEQAALNRYISSESYTLNEALRNGFSLSESQQKLVKDLDSALDKLPKYKGDVTRSLIFPDMDSAQTYIKSIRGIDGSINFKQYISATASPELYDDSGQVQIRIKNTYSGSDLTPLNQNEMEVLFNRNAEFGFIECIQDQGVWLITLKEVTDGKR